MDSEQEGVSGNQLSEFSKRVLNRRELPSGSSNQKKAVREKQKEVEKKKKYPERSKGESNKEEFSRGTPFGESRKKIGGGKVFIFRFS